MARVVKKAIEEKSDWMARQGDVLIVKDKTIPKGSKKAKNCIVAQGVATGHSHRIEAGAEQWVAPDGTQYVKVLKRRVSLKHHEHAAISLSGPGVYRVVHQREYTPQGSVNVLD